MKACQQKESNIVEVCDQWRTKQKKNRWQRKIELEEKKEKYELYVITLAYVQYTSSAVTMQYVTQRLYHNEVMPCHIS